MALIDDYKKKRKALQSKIYYYKKKGIIIETKIPKPPKKVTQKSIERLEKLTTEKLLKKTKFVDVQTGEKITRKQHQKLPKVPTKKSVKKDEYVQSIKIYKEIFLEQIERFSERANQIVKWWLSKQIARYGDLEVFKNISNMATQGLFLTEQELASSDEQYEPLFSKLEQMVDYMALSGEDREIFSPSTDIDGAQLYDSEGEELF